MNDTKTNEANLQYWREQLQNVPENINLPFDNKKQPGSEAFFQTETIDLNIDLLDQLNSLARRENTSLFVLVSAAFLLLLHRYSGDEEICLGINAYSFGYKENSVHSPTLDREKSPFYGIIIKSKLSDGLTFFGLLHQTASLVKKGLDHSFDALTVALRELPRSESGTWKSVFQTSLSQIDNFEGEHFKFESGDISGILSEQGSKTAFHFRYNKNLFKPETVKRILRSFKVLLENIAINPEQSAQKVSILATEDLSEILTRIKGNSFAFPACNAVHEYFETQVDLTPGQVAIEFEGKALTYKELEQRSNQLANYLKSQGVGRNKFVGIFMERSLEMFISILATFKAGGAYVPLDPEYPKDRLDFLIEDIEAPVILSQGRLRDQLPQEAMNKYKVTSLNVDQEWDYKITMFSAERNKCTNEPQDAAYMIYTSGSTGKPKGCVNTHQGIANYLQCRKKRQPLTTKDKILQKTPFTFDVSIGESLWPLISGATLVISRPGGHRDPSYLINIINERSITHLDFVPSMFQLFLEEEQTKTCKSIKRVILIGEAVPLTTIKKFYEILPSAALINSYGPTEAAVACTDIELYATDRAVTIGYPLPNCEIYILDEFGQPTPVGVFGELCIGGIQVAKGYWKREDLTREKFINDPFSNETGRKIYKTGDRARFLPNGTIDYQGRMDFQVKVRGFRVELGEIEALLVSHPKISQATVVLKAIHGEQGAKSLVAYYVTKNRNDDISSDSLKEYIKQKLPEYMTPAFLIPMSELPLITSGKVDRKALMARKDELKIDVKITSAPMDDLEKNLISVWQEVLKVTPIGRDDNYFALGGDSLGMISIRRKLLKLNIDLEIKEFIKNQTVAQLGSVIRNRISKTS